MNSCSVPRLWRITSIGLATFVILLVLAYATENWRGRQAWHQEEQRLVAAGDKLDFSAYAPVPVPSGQNFIAVPLMRHLLSISDVRAKPTPEVRRLQPFLNLCNSRSVIATRPLDLAAARQQMIKFHLLEATHQADPAQDILAALAPIQADLDSLVLAAAQRPAAQLEFNHHSYLVGPALHWLPSVGRLIALRAEAELALGQSEKAYGDTVVLMRLISATATWPHTSSTMIGHDLLGLLVHGPFLAGWQRQVWNDGQLAQFAYFFASYDSWANLITGLRAERVGIAALLDDPLFIQDLNEQTPWARLMPSGWLQQNRATYSRWMTEAVLGSVTAAGDRIDLPKFFHNLEPYHSTRWTPYTFIARMAFPGMSYAVLKLAESPPARDEALIVCALERYRNAHGAYPESLAGLIPTYLARIPLDPASGRLPSYRRTVGGAFQLASAGAEEKPDGRPQTANWRRVEWTWLPLVRP